MNNSSIQLKPTGTRAKLQSSPPDRGLALHVSRKTRTDKIIRAAVAEHQRDSSTTAEIAKRYGVSPATISVWARKSGALLRSRGRRPAPGPTKHQMAILEAVRHKTYESVARENGVTRQRIHWIVKRWRHLVGRRIKHSTVRSDAVTSLRNAGENRRHVVSFRLRDSELRALLPRQEQGLSVNQLAREIVLDSLSS
jgi:transposase-like protein